MGKLSPHDQWPVSRYRGTRAPAEVIGVLAPSAPAPAGAWR